MNPALAVVFTEIMLQVRRAETAHAARLSAQQALARLQDVGGANELTRELSGIVREYRSHRIRTKLRSMKDARYPAESALAEACGLTRRECEVLHWLACAKRDREIAAILGIAVRTARKHVEHVRAKLHVETRMAAVAAAQDLLRARSSRHHKL